MSGPRVSETESKPFIVTSTSGVRGLAKPGVPKGPMDAHAAHEKIAADLAYHLGLPVAPATLWARDAEHPTQHVCIAAWAFDTCDTWDRLQAYFDADE